MMTIREYKRAESLEEAWQLNQKKPNRILGGMIWLKMETINVGTGMLAPGAFEYSFSASQLDEMLMSIPAPQPVEPQKRSDILDVIGYDEDGQSTLGWPQAAECFDPLRQTSYWWTNRCDGYPLYTHVHSGNFTGQLFTLLFDPAGGARPGRHGLYPPMFE